jgi:hypothetical protein
MSSCGESSIWENLINVPERWQIRPVHVGVWLTGLNLFSVARSNRFPSGIVELLCEPFRFRRTKGMESSNVDEVKIICSRFGHSRCNERHGNNQRQRFFRCIQAL